MNLSRPEFVGQAKYYQSDSHQNPCGWFWYGGNIVRANIIHLKRFVSVKLMGVMVQGSHGVIAGLILASGAAIIARAGISQCKQLTCQQ